jgi:putative hydrolase of the HAD superfamily
MRFVFLMICFCFCTSFGLSLPHGKKVECKREKQMRTLNKKNSHVQPKSSAVKNKRFQMIVFDFGRVIGGKKQKKLAETIAKELKISPDEAKDLVHGFKKRECSKKEFWETFSQEKGVTFPQGWSERFDELKLDAIETDPDMMKIVKTLHSQGYRMAILSNTTPKRAAHIRELGFYDHFDPVILSCEAGVSKPQKEAYEILLLQAKVPAAHCIFIDDKQENVQAAAQLGFDVILFTTVKDLQLALEKRSISMPEGVEY